MHRKGARLPTLNQSGPFLRCLPASSKEGLWGKLYQGTGTVTHRFSNTVSALASGFAAALLAIAMTAGAAIAQSERFDSVTVELPDGRVIKGEEYIPTIWIDPDGCEHWVMDDGVEGYMDLRRTRKGMPICHEVNTCGVVKTDQYFATDSARISKAGRARLAEFFKNSTAFAFSVIGHTDSRASDEYNTRLSYRRANAVAKVAKATGARVIDVRGYGERMPVAPNNSAAGMAKNRRVEILCFK